MKQNLMLRRLIIILTGSLLFVYAAYNVYIIFMDSATLPAEGILISSFVALLFVVLSAFVWTAAWKTKAKDIRFLMTRRLSFIIALLVMIALKIRLAGRYVDYLNFSNMISIAYCGAYFLTLTALMILFVYYAFIRKFLPFYPRASIVLPLSAIGLFLCSLIFEAILFFVYGIGLESNSLRTLLIRPIFYLGLIGLCAYFLLPPQKTAKTDNVTVDDLANEIMAIW